MAGKSRTVRWWIAIAVWASMLAAFWIGPRADPWLQAVAWTTLAVLSAAALIRWRPGQIANLPRGVQRWMTDERQDD